MKRQNSLRQHLKPKNRSETQNGTEHKTKRNNENRNETTKRHNRKQGGIGKLLRNEARGVRKISVRQWEEQRIPCALVHGTTLSIHGVHAKPMWVSYTCTLPPTKDALAPANTRLKKCTNANKECYGCAVYFASNKNNTSLQTRPAGGKFIHCIVWVCGGHNQHLQDHLQTRKYVRASSAIRRSTAGLSRPVFQPSARRSR